MSGACKVCGGEVPPHSNPGRVRKLCNDPECARADRREAGRRARAEYLRRHPPLAERTHYTCSRCGVEKRIGRENFYPERRDPETGEVAAWSRWCIPCKLEAASVRNLTVEQHRRRKATSRRAYAARMRKLREGDPEALARARANWNAAALRWRRNNPEVAAAVQRRFRENLSLDPARLAAARERDRIARRLRREREGVPLDEQRRGRDADRLPETRMPGLPAAPLAVALEAMIDRSDVDRDGLCDELGLTPRTLYAWRRGERKTVQFWKVDLILTRAGLNWWDVWDPDHLRDECPRAYECLAA